MLYKQSEATITIGQNAELIGSGTIGLYAAAAADASGMAKSKLFSVGYGEAKATAIVDIRAGALIQSTGDAMVVTSDAKAASKIKAETTQEEGDSGLAGSLAVGNVSATPPSPWPKTRGSRRHKTANLRANGDIKTETEAEGSTFVDGTVGWDSAFRSRSRPSTPRWTAQSLPTQKAGTLNKLEIDPTATDFTTEQFDVDLTSGNTIQLLEKVSDDLPAGTLMT